MNVGVTAVYSVTREIIARMRERVRVRARERATYQHLFASFYLCGGMVLAGICNSRGVGIVCRRALFPGRQLPRLRFLFPLSADNRLVAHQEFGGWPIPCHLWHGLGDGYLVFHGQDCGPHLHGAHRHRCQGIHVTLRGRLFPGNSLYGDFVAALGGEWVVVVQTH